MEIKELKRLVFDHIEQKQKIIPVDEMQPCQYNIWFIIWRIEHGN